MEKKLTKLEQKRLDLENEMGTTFVNTLKGKYSLIYLINNIGVKNKVEYFNKLERKAPKSIRSISNPTIIKDITHDYGLIFNNGEEIRHVSKQVFDYVSCDIVKKRERNPNA